MPRFADAAEQSGERRHGPPSSVGSGLPLPPRPLFLIYAGKGGGGEELNPDYYDAASRPRALWRIPEAGHVGGFQASPGEYEQCVTRFFDRALLGG